MVLLDAPTYPGVVIPCRPVALLEVEQDARGGGRQRNDRVIAEPAVARRRVLEILGWAGAAAADRLIDRARRSR